MFQYQVSSKIITVLTQEHGKIALIARGAKRPKGKFSGIIEIGNILDVVYYYKASRGVQSLSEATVHYASINFRKELERASILYATLELAAQLVHDNENNEAIFDFLLKFIPWIGDHSIIFASIFCYVQIRLAELTGFNLTLESDDTSNTLFFDITHGLISANYNSELSYKLSVLQTSFIQEVLTSRSP